VDRGIGVIVLFVAIAPLAGFGATQLYTAEAATPVQERLTPRIRDMVKVLAFVYGGLTLGGIVILHLGGMGTFDAVNYALTRVPTGGTLPTRTPWPPSTPGPSSWRSRRGW